MPRITHLIIAAGLAMMLAATPAQSLEFKQANTKCPEFVRISEGFDNYKSLSEDDLDVVTAWIWP